MNEYRTKHGAGYQAEEPNEVEMVDESNDENNDENEQS